MCILCMACWTASFTGGHSVERCRKLADNEQFYCIKTVACVGARARARGAQ